jgi:hypothetical protein
MGDESASPIRALREKLLVDVDGASNAFSRWFRFAAGILQEAADSAGQNGTARASVPKGFVDLTYLLASVCDIGRFSIDPSPLTDFLRMCQHMEVDGMSETYSHSVDELIKAADRVVPVANRLLWAMVAVKGGGGHALLEPKFVPGQRAQQNDHQEHVVETASDQSQPAPEPEQSASPE